jgi:hypothetical protein
MEVLLERAITATTETHKREAVAGRNGRDGTPVPSSGANRDVNCVLRTPGANLPPQQAARRAAPYDSCPSSTSAPVNCVLLRVSLALHRGTIGIPVVIQKCSILSVSSSPHRKIRTTRSALDPVAQIKFRLTDHSNSFLNS